MILMMLTMVDPSWLCGLLHYDIPDTDLLNKVLNTLNGRLDTGELLTEKPSDTSSHQKKELTPSWT